MQIKTIIVEDELMSRKALEKLCSKVNDIELIGSCEDGIKGLEYLEKNEVDLLFLDIEMPGMTGLQLLEKLSYFPQIVFTTTNKEYAFEALEYEITDFLMKPITLPRFQKAMERVNDNIQQLNKSANFSAQNEIYVKQDGRYIRVPFNEILYFENVGDYVKVFTENGNYIIYGALKAIDARLNHPALIKVHRSYIVNLGKIKDIEDNTLVIGKKVIPISRAHRPTLLKTINIL